MRILILNIITNKEKIEKNQIRFEELFKSKATKEIEGHIGYKGGQDFVKIYWIESLRIWGVFERIENRFWNAFGDQEPTDRNNRSIIVEINFPFKDIDSQIAGVFAKDETDAVYVLHRGKIGGGQKGFGKKSFFEHYIGDFVELEEKQSKTVVAKVGCLDSDNFLFELKKFINEIKRIKRAIKSV